MIYYYYLLRYNLSNRMHNYRRDKFDRSWKKHILNRERLKIVGSSIGIVEKIDLLRKIR